MRTDKNGNIVSYGGDLVGDSIIVPTNSETFAKQAASSRYSREHNVSPTKISVRSVREL